MRHARQIRLVPNMLHRSLRTALVVLAPAPILALALFASPIELPTSALARASERKNEFHFVISGPTWGELDPCGCSAGMHGGLDRRLSLLQALASDPRTIAIDCGDLTGPPRMKHQPALPLFDALKQALVLQALARMPYDGYCIGDRDLKVPPLETGLALPSSFRNEFYGLAAVGQTLFDRLPVLTNVTCEIPDLWQPWRVLGAEAAKRVLLTCVVAADDPAWDPLYRFADPVSSLQTAIRSAEAEGPLDLVVCVYHGPTREAAQNLARNVPEVGLVLWADHEHADDASAPIVMEGGCPIIAPGARGTKVLEMQLSRSGGATRVEGLQAHAVDESSIRDPELSRLTPAFRERAAANVPSLTTHYAGQVLPEAADLYVGSQACARCHAEAYSKWQESKHAHAYETLAANTDKTAGSLADPNCVSCHTVGYGERFGFADPRNAGIHIGGENDRRALDDALKGVGCESCHGPGLAHSLRPTGPQRKAMSGVGARARETCYSCHDAENSPGFSFDEYWERIRHH